MLDEIVESYLDYLLTLPEHRTRFAQRLADHPPGARAEAAMFAFLRVEGCQPLLSEDTGTGGTDFCCQHPERFVVEVTSLDDVTLANRADIAQDVPANGEGGALDMEEVLNLVRTTVSGKAAQLADYPVPRVLAICSEHWGTSMFFGPGGAEEIMYGGSSITTPFTREGASGLTQITTELRDAPFFRIKDGKSEACRRSISALLLVHLDPTACHIVGLLHPDPAITFPIQNLPEIPFGRVAWPAKELRVEWLLAAPRQARFSHEEIALSGDELRDGVQASPCGISVKSTALQNGVVLRSVRGSSYGRPRTFRDILGRSGATCHGRCDIERDDLFAGTRARSLLPRPRRRCATSQTTPITSLMSESLA